MGHDASKILMGTTRSNHRTAPSRKGSVPAGIAAYLKSDDTYSATAADGTLKGISLGGDLSKAGFNPVAEAGLGIPLQLEAGFNPVIGAPVHILKSTGKGAAADTEGSTTTAINGTWASERKTGIMEDGTEVGAAYIDIVGGV